MQATAIFVAIFVAILASFLPLINVGRAMEGSEGQGVRAPYR